MFEKKAHELSDVNTKALMFCGLGLVVIALVIHLSLSALFFALRRDHQSILPADIDALLLRQRGKIPEPRLQPNPPLDLKKYLKQEDRILSTYGWLNRQKGRVRIPIHRAMQLWINQAEKRDPSLTKKRKDSE